MCVCVSRAVWLPAPAEVSVIVPQAVPVLPVPSAQCHVWLLLRFHTKLLLLVSWALPPPHALGRIWKCGNCPGVFISHSHPVVSSFILVHLLHTEVAIELLSFYVKKKSLCEGRYYIVNICCKPGSVIYARIPGVLQLWGGFGKAAVEQETKQNVSIFSLHQKYIFQILSVKIQRWVLHSYLEYRQFLLTIIIVLCWLCSCYYLFPAFRVLFFFFCKVMCGLK